MPPTIIDSYINMYTPNPAIRVAKICFMVYFFKKAHEY